MGKNLHHHHPGIFLQGNGPAGCMWGVLHVLKSQNWRQIKKRLPHRKGGSGSSKHASKLENTEDDTKTLKIDTSTEHCNARNEDSTVDDKSTQCSTPSKGSVASRLKALISDEISKMRGRHHRSATCPAQSQLTRIDSIHHLEPSYEDVNAVVELADESSMIVVNDVTALMDSSTEEFSDDQRFEECETVLSDYPLKENQFGKMKKQENKVPNLNHVKQFNVDASNHQSKEMLDALDMVNMNKELIVEILKTSGSPLAHHFHNEQAMNNKLRYSKTVSFPSPESSYKISSRPEKSKLKQEGFSSCVREENLQDVGHQGPKLAAYMWKAHSAPVIAAEYRADGILKQNQTMAETANNHLRKNGHNQMAIKRFKDLRHKIKHAIQECKHEKHRIAMDAILHKIPHRHGFSKDLRKELLDQTRDHYMTKDFRDSPRSSYESDRSLPSTIKSELRITSRTSSFSESLDRYCQLYECSFNRETKHHNTETSRLRSEHENLTRIGSTKSMRRIFSLPNIKYTEASSDAFAESHARTVTDGTTGHDHPAATEKIVQLDPKSDSDRATISNNEDWQEEKLESISKAELDANVVDIGDDVSNLVIKETTSEDIPQFATNSITKPEEVENISVFNYDAQEAETRHTPASKVKVYTEEDLEPTQTHFHPMKLDILGEQLQEFNVDTPKLITDSADKTEFSCKSLNERTLHLQVNAKDKAEFDYVRDILEISGFIKNEPLGTWPSEEQPMDRSVLEEVKDCIFFDPKCHGSEEEGSSCYHVLLFDLINEVLMEIYAKSYAYYSKPLTFLSQIRLMPIGHHVLEEVWTDISWYLSSSLETDHQQSLDYIVSRDLAKSDGWMNTQYEAECVGLELEDLIFDHLLEEIICS